MRQFRNLAARGWSKLSGKTVPLAWLNLLESKRRLLASVGGVAFSVVLIFVELGFLDGIYDSQSHMLALMNADLVMVHRHKVASHPKRPFPRQRIVQARSVPGVEATFPVYLEEYRALWKNRAEGKEYPIRVLAFNPDDPAFLEPAIAEQIHKLKVPGAALIDSRSNDYYGSLTPGVAAELNGHTVRVVGVFPMGPNFRTDGNLLVSDRTFFECFHDPISPAREIRGVEFGLIKIAGGSEVEAVRQAIAERLPQDVKVYKKADFILSEKQYWGKTKAVGQVFGMGALVGFFIGMMICYQILYTGVLDRLPQYATLKAMGYSSVQLMQIVLMEGVYLSLLGFLPGVLVSLVVYFWLEQRTGLIMHLTLSRAFPVLLITVGMCVLAGMMAAVKSIQEDPAELFR